MPELGPYGSVRGARGNSRPYRESNRMAVKATLMTDFVEKGGSCDAEISVIQSV
jgi:hypothetical protein